MEMDMAYEPPPARQKQGYPPRHSAADNTFHRTKPISSELYGNHLDPEDFADVFGGPPRTILLRQLARSSFMSSFYERIVWPHEVGHVVDMVGRRLPEFKIPVRSRSENEQIKFQDSLYNDTLEWEDQTMVQSRSSSILLLSSEELILLGPAVSSGSGGDEFSTSPTKFRPTDQWKSTSLMAKEVNKRQQYSPAFVGNQQIYSSDSEDSCFENLRNYPPFESSQRNASAETFSLEPISNCSVGESEVDFEVNSPSSKYYCSHSDQRQKTSEVEEDEANSTIVNETSSDDRRETCEPNDIDEAIAWAKQKFQTHYSETSKWRTRGSDQEKDTEETLSRSSLSEGYADSYGSQHNKCATEQETEQQILDEKIRVWSTGKQADIRLLLSSLHHILWPNSGWLAISLTNLIQRSQVKKAYQKACLCLHPDKLQQRDAILARKYIAEKAFSTLQEAWAAFISLQVCCS